MTVFRQDWEESERGWGSRPDGYSLHRTPIEVQIFIVEYWKTMPDEVLDEYSRPDGTPYEVEVDAVTYGQVAGTKYGKRYY